MLFYNSFIARARKSQEEPGRARKSQEELFHDFYTTYTFKLLIPISI